MIDNIKPANKVYFSSLIRQKYSDDWANIENVLLRHNINFGFLEGTKDIWCRDYMPVTRPDGKLVQFRYEPSYLEGFRELQSDPFEINKLNGIKTGYSEINLDGGNVIWLGETCIVTDRFLDENPGIPVHENLIRQLENALDARVITIRSYSKSEDFTGHADGMLRYLEPGKLLVNDFQYEYQYVQRDVLKLINLHGLEMVQVPLFEYREKDYPLSAIGVYINYLVIGKLILIPEFAVPGNRDKEALAVFKKNFTGYKVETVNINNIARLGGLLNCISWDIYEPELRVMGRMGDKLFIALDGQAESSKLDFLVIKADQKSKAMVNTSWSYQKHLKYNGAYIEPVSREESRDLLLHINRDWKTKDYRAMLDELENPGKEGLMSLIPTLNQ